MSTVVEVAHGTHVAQATERTEPWGRPEVPQQQHDRDRRACEQNAVQDVAPVNAVAVSNSAYSGASNAG